MHETEARCRDDDDDINEDGWWRWTCHFCACMRRCAIDLHGSWFLYFIPAGADPCGSSLLRCWSIVFMMYKCLRSRGWFQLFWMTLVTVGVANLESSSQLHVLAAIAGMSAERWAFPGSCSELAKQVELSATHDQSQTGTGDEFLKRGFQCFFYCQHFLPTFASLRYFFFCCCLRWQHPQRLEYSEHFHYKSVRNIRNRWKLCAYQRFFASCSHSFAKRKRNFCV